MLRGAALVGAVVILAGARYPAVPVAARGAQRVAVTIDDLPWSGLTSPDENVGEATRRLLATLVSRNVPATGFVNCARTRPDDPVLRAWRAAGMDLGNHGSNHLNIDNVDALTW